MTTTTMFKVKVYREADKGGAYETIGYALTEALVKAIIDDHRATNQVYQYWIDYAVDKDNNIKYYVDKVELTVG